MRGIGIPLTERGGLFARPHPLRQHIDLVWGKQRATLDTVREVDVVFVQPFVQQA